MIKDRLVNADSYFGLSENFKKGFEWLRQTDLLNFPDGKYEIAGNQIYANVQSYETKDNALYEAHRRYADIQYMIRGKEKAGVIDYSECTAAEVYNEDKDIEFLNYSGKEYYEELKEGEFLIFFPQDAHKPSINCETKSFIKKTVVKVLL